MWLCDTHNNNIHTYSYVCCNVFKQQQYVTIVCHAAESACVLCELYIEICMTKTTVSAFILGQLNHVWM